VVAAAASVKGTIELGGSDRPHPQQARPWRSARAPKLAAVVPVDLFVFGCPPHPLTMLDRLLWWLGKVRG
jgi:Ni,Fe-hydrogenase III small subunit